MKAVCLCTVLLLLWMSSSAEAFNITLNGPRLAPKIANISLSLPDQTVVIDSVNVNLYLTDLVCFNISIGGIQGNLTAFGYINQKASPSLATIAKDIQKLIGVYMGINAYDLALNCTANFTYERTSIPKLSGNGNMSFSLGDHTYLDVDIVIKENRTTASPTPSVSFSSTISMSTSFSNTLTPTPSVTMTPTATPTMTPSVSDTSSTTTSPTGTASITPTDTSTSTGTPSISDTSSITPSISDTSSNTPSPQTQSPTPTSTASTSKSGRRFGPPNIDNTSYHVATNYKDSSKVKALQTSRYSLTDSESNMMMMNISSVNVTDIGQPVFQGSIQYCNMSSHVTYSYSNNSLFMSSEESVIEVIEALVPEILCTQLNQLISQNITYLINNMTYIIKNHTDYLQSQPEEVIFDAHGATLGLIGAIILFLLICVVCGLIEYRRYIIRKRSVTNNERTRLNQNTMPEAIDPTASIQSINIDNDEYNELYSEFNAGFNLNVMYKNSPLILSPKISMFWRYFVLLLILLNIALFCSATISVAASVYIYLTVGDEQFRLPSLYSFKLVSSVEEMWDAGVWPLSLLIGGTSGVWPYMKLVFMFFCWLTPVNVLSAKWRGRFLTVLDVLGKWSLIDAYVLVLFLEAFRVHFTLGEEITFDMVVEVEYAFYSYLVATMSSLILTHIILHFHRAVCQPPIPATGKEALRSHQFNVSTAPLISGTFTKFGIIFVVLSLVVTIAAIFIGNSFPAFSFDYSGSLLGTVLDLLKIPKKTFSIFSLTSAIPDTTLNAPNGFGIRVIQTTFIMFACVIPVCFLIALAIVWLVPLTSKAQHYFFIFVEILNAWAAIDVFVVALVVALLELEQFAAFIIAGKCGLIDKLVSLLPNAPEDPTCFTVRATLASGAAILVVAVIILLVVGYGVMVLCNKAINERWYNERQIQKRKDLAEADSLRNDTMSQQTHFSLRSFRSTKFGKTVYSICGGLCCVRLEREVYYD